MLPIIVITIIAKLTIAASATSAYILIGTIHIMVAMMMTTIINSTNNREGMIDG